MDRYFQANAVLSVFSKRYMDLKSELPVRPSEMGVINIITGTDGPHTPAVLAKLLGVSKPMITAHIISLEKKGYIAKSPAAHDRRVYYILPTPKADELAARAREATDAQLERLMNAMGRDKFDELVRLADIANGIIANEGE